MISDSRQTAGTEEISTHPAEKSAAQSIPFGSLRITTLGFLVFMLVTMPEICTASDIGDAVQHLAEKLAFSNRGEVLSVTGDTLYLSLGQEDGILEGSRFEVVRRGALLRAGDEILGYEETPVGTAEALRVRGKVTVARLTESTRAPQKGDRVFQLKKGIGRVVVTQFRDDRGFNGLTENLQARLATALVNQGMQVVERSQLERVLREQKLGYSGLIEIGSAKKIGQLLGAEGIVLGSIGDLGNTVTVSARLVDLEAGSSVAATEVSLAKTPLITGMRGAISEETLIEPGIGYRKPVIKVLSGSYGINCGASKGNVTKQLASFCDGKESCKYKIDYMIIGDPALGCGKNYIATWQCGNNQGIFEKEISPEAGYGKIINLYCNQ